MSVPVKPSCPYCRGTMDDAWGFGLCMSCVMDRLRESPHEGMPMVLPNGKHNRAYLCTRCGGSGHVYASSRTPDTYCYGCAGEAHFESVTGDTEWRKVED